MRGFELTRRRLLAGLGGVGVASAGAGLGTTAYFNDAETFTGNQIVAGTLDLKVDWQEHYYFDQESVTVDVHATEPSDGGSYVGLPDPDDPEWYVAMGDVADFLQQTAIEAYPDTNDDGVQDQFAAYPTADGGTTTQICESTSDLDAALASDLRTEETVHGQTTTSGDSLVMLKDVKPGDFGEVTFSLHLCGNPGYVWLNGALEANDENTVLESEVGAPGENATTATDTPVSGGGELADALRVVFWYDTGAFKPGDNVDVPGELPILGSGDVVHTAPVPLRDAMSYLSTGRGIPLDGNLTNGSPDLPPDPLTIEQFRAVGRSEARDCFTPSTSASATSYYVGFAWWLPRDVGNAVQTDSVEFDLGFYTEQCRHNEGGGRPQSTTNGGDGTP